MLGKEGCSELRRGVCFWQEGRRLRSGKERDKGTWVTVQGEQEAATSL